MFCTNCGKQLPDGTCICDGCNTVLGEQHAQEPAKAFAPEYANTAPGNVVNNFYQEKKSPISVLGWIGRSLINFIPIVGPIIYFIMLFIWAGDKTKEESFNNWAKAQLIMMLIGAVIGILFVVILVSLGILGANSIANNYGVMY